MKRQSKVEEALATQSKNIDNDINRIYRDIDSLKDQATALRRTRDMIDDEIRRLRHIREHTPPRKVKP